MFKRTLYLECRKAIRNRLFVIAIAVGCIVTLCSLIPQVKSYYRGIQVVNGFSEVFQHRNPHAAMNTLYNHWVGGETHTLGSSVYFFIFPLLVAIPYGWSFCNEHRIGYTRCMVLKTGKFPYYFAKYCAVFLSGGLTMVIPLVFNFLLTAMFVPAVCPDPSYLIWYAVNGASLMSELYYTYPAVYVLLYLAIDFLFCGLIACLSYSISTIYKNRVVVVLLPFFLLLGLNFADVSIVYTSNLIRYTEFSPIYFLHPAAARYDAGWNVILIEALILFVLTFVPTVIKGKGNEIY